tara:strand:+ start:260 stop:418 length:159 start_codon:yes stop_codon:yes gene_type:complete
LDKYISLKKSFNITYNRGVFLQATKHMIGEGLKGIKVNLLCYQFAKDKFKHL